MIVENFYDHYLKSDEWNTKKRNLKRHCEKCLCKKRLDLHHATYENLGVERAGDLMVLCRNCHEELHKLYKESGEKDLYKFSYRFVWKKVVPMQKVKKAWKYNSHCRTIAKIEPIKPQNRPHKIPTVRYAPVSFFSSTDFLRERLKRDEWSYNPNQ